MKYAAFNLNFDSLSEAYGFPSDYRDSSYETVSRRFLRLADEYGFKYSIYVIGRDLERPQNRELVKEWASRGHEIGNHSWSHPVNLGAMKKQDIRREVEMSHEIITAVTGCEPKGFIAPGWSTSTDLLEILIDLNYLYDTSSFPSWIMYLSLLKILINHVGDKRFFKTLHRKDLLCPLLGRKDSFFSRGSIYGAFKLSEAENGTKGIRILPLPTSRYGIACWHTLVFMLGQRLHSLLLKSCLDDIEAFYYLMHPADLIDQPDLDPARDIHWERINIPLAKKDEYLRRSIEFILESGRKIVTMKELAMHS